MLIETANESDLYTIEQAAERIGISHYYVLQLCALWKLKKERIPNSNRWFIHADEIERYKALLGNSAV